MKVSSEKANPCLATNRRGVWIYTINVAQQLQAKRYSQKSVLKFSTSVTANANHSQDKHAHSAESPKDETLQVAQRKTQPWESRVQTPWRRTCPHGRKQSERACTLLASKHIEDDTETTMKEETSISKEQIDLKKKQNF